MHQKDMPSGSHPQELAFKKRKEAIDQPNGATAVTTYSAIVLAAIAVFA